MPDQWTPNLEDVPVEESLDLVIATRQREALQAYDVQLQPDAEQALRQACREALDHLRSARAVPFGPDVYLDEDEYLAVAESVVGADHPVLATVGRAGHLEQLELSSSPRVWFYAVVVGDDPDSRWAFVRKSDPHVVTKGRSVVFTGANALRVLKTPVFVFEDRFDVIIGGGGIAALRTTPFEILFRHAEQLDERAEAWIKTISEQVAIDDESASLLLSESKRSTSIARRVRSIHDRGHLAGVGMATIRAAAESRGLDVTSLFDGENLVLREGTDLQGVLRLLNEDLFAGALTGQEFAADRKRVV